MAFSAAAARRIDEHRFGGEIDRRRGGERHGIARSKIAPDNTSERNSSMAAAMLAPLE